MIQTLRAKAPAIDTEIGARDTAPPLSRASRGVVHLGRGVLATALACVACLLPARAHSEPELLDARVVYADNGRVYVAADDSTALAVGDLLTLSSRGKTIAEARVTATVSGLAVATLTSGSLVKEKKLERLSVARERIAARAPTSLRIGYPASGRDNLLLACGRWAPGRLTATGYAVDSFGPRSWRLTREGGTGAWPDTLLIRLFEESIDEEIAIERGELDAAVFWPGELSAHMREHSRFGTPLFAARGALTASIVGMQGSDASALAPVDSAALETMNQSLFRGDLIRLPESRRTSVSPPAAQFEVPGELPGSSRLTSFLAGARVSATNASGPRIRLAFYDAPARAEELTDDVLFPVRFAARCPIVCAPGSRAVVGPIADVLVQFGCRP
jgi:hypothetical protein